MIQAKAGRTSEDFSLRWHDGLDCREDCFTSEQRAARRGESSQHLMQSNKT